MSVFVFCFKKFIFKIVNLFNRLNPKLSFNASNIYSFKKRMKENVPFTNSFFANFDFLYYDMDNPTIPSILDKIKKFPEDIFDFLMIFSLF